MTIDLAQLVHYRIEIDGTTTALTGHDNIQGVIRAFLLAARDPSVIWRGRGEKHIRFDLSNFPIKAASDMTRVDEIAAGMEFDMTEDEYLEQQTNDSIESNIRSEPGIGSDPQMVRLININYSKAAFESALPDEIQSLLTYARLNYPIWFTHTFVKKHIP